MIGKWLDPPERERLRNGDISILYNHLLDVDKRLVIKLKASKDETRLYQGASHVVDYLLEILK